MSEIISKISQAPYNANFDPSKNYVHVAFKAGGQVQASEMNDFQLELHNQIKTFGNHMFKNGAIISGGTSTLKKVDYVTIDEDFNLDVLSDDIKFIGKTSSVEGSFIKAVNRTETDPATFYIKYTKTGSDGQTNKFLHGEELYIVDSNNVTIGTVTVRCPSCANSTDIWRDLPPIGYGSIFNILDGMIYFEGYFISFVQQSILAGKYEQPLDIKIGFDFRSQIITHVEDVSLYDNSLGYPNRGAIGADRLQLSLDLIAYPNGDGNGDKFILMMKIDKFGVVSFVNDETAYADLMDMLAKRTYEINGNFTINPTKLAFLNDKKKDAGDVHGYQLDGDDNKLVCVTTPFTSYVMGYRTNKISHNYIPFDKARETNKISYTKRFDDRAFIIVEVVSDNAYPNGGAYNSFMDGSKLLIYTLAGAGNNVTGDIIGECEATDITTFDESKSLYKLYVTNIHMFDGKQLSEAKCIANTANQFVSNIPQEYENNILNNVNDSGLIFKIDKADIKSLRSSENSKNGSIIINLRKVFKTTADASGKVQFETIDNELFANIDNDTICMVEVDGNRKKVKLDSTNTNFSPQSISIDFGAGYSGAICTVLQTVQRINQKEKVKTLVASSMMTSFSPTNTIGDSIPLGLADAYSLTSVQLYILMGDGEYKFVEDVTDKFQLVSGITDVAYYESKIKQIGEFVNAVGVDHRLQIDVMYFEHSGSTGYFTIDSYSDVFNDSKNDITFANLVNYISPTSSTTYDLRSCIDFRPIIMKDSRVNALLPSNNSTMLFNAEYYLPRVDTLIINDDGHLKMIKGISSDTPQPPKINAPYEMGLYHVYLKPYTYTLKDINVKFIENRRYTMRDIGKIDEKVDKAIYYILTDMERGLADTSVKDADGMDRFKNGFFAEAFGNFSIGDVNNHEFSCAFNLDAYEMRPKFSSRNTKLIFDEKTSNAFHSGGMIMHKYTTEVVLDQAYSTKSVSINPYFITQRKGKMALMPNQDTWSDQTILPDLVIDIDAGAEALKELSDKGFFGTVWGEWEDLNSTTRTDVSRGNGGTTTTVTTDTEQRRDGIDAIIGSKNESHDLGEVVRDVEIQPFIRPQIIQFVVVGLIPNTVFYPYFDKQPVTEYCRDIGYQIDGNNITEVARLMQWGAPLVSDKNGELYGEFRIEEGKFKTGQREFILTTNKSYNIADDEDMSWCLASAEFTSNGIKVDKQGIKLNVDSPTVDFKDTTEERVVSESISEFRPSPPPDRGGGGGGDPLAQAFILEQDRFIDGVSLFFNTVQLDSTVIWVQLRTMKDGYPTDVVLAEKKYYDFEKIPFSDDATAELKVEFNNPVFMQGGISYCMVVGGDSMYSRIFVAKLNDPLIEFPDKILEQTPLTESSFRSKNGTTWTAEQYEVVKFKLHGCVFDIEEPLVANFNQENIESVLGENPVETELGNNRIRIYCDDHGFVVNDRFTLSLSRDRYFRVKVEGEPLSPQIGQTITTNTFTAEIIDSKVVENKPNEFDIKVNNITGTIIADQSFSCASISVKPINSFVFTQFDVAKKAETVIPQVVGMVISDFSDDYPLNQLNGIPLSEFNKEHVVKEVDSINSVIIEVNVPANSSGRRGGNRSTVISNFNFKYDLINVSGAYLPYKSSERWTYQGINYGMPNTKYESIDGMESTPLEFTPSETTELQITNKIMSNINEKRILGQNGKSVNVGVKFKSNNMFLSPVLNAQSFSLTTISNKVGVFNSELMDVAPNSSNRYLDEASIVGGSNVYKYVTKPMRLKDPAMDVKLWIDVYKDVDADFDIYVKLLSESSMESIDDIPWVKLNFDKSYNSPNSSQKKEYELLLSDCIDSLTNDFKFKIYKFKITGQTINSAKPPIFSSFRGIAVT